MGSSSGSEYCVSENISNRAGSTGKVGCRTITLLGVVWYKVWVFFCKNSKSGVSTNVLSKSNHTHGGGYIRRTCTGKSRIRLRSNLQKTILYAGVYLIENLFRKTSFL